MVARVTEYRILSLKIVDYSFSPLYIILLWTATGGSTTDTGDYTEIKQLSDLGLIIKYIHNEINTV